MSAKILALTAVFVFSAQVAFAIECDQTMPFVLTHELSELRFFSSEFNQVDRSVSSAALELMRAVDESPWRTPETNIWRRLFVRALHDPQSVGEVRLPIDDVRPMFLDLLSAPPLGLPLDSALRARIAQAMSQTEVTYRTYAEIGADATIEYQKLHLGMLRESERTPESLAERRDRLLQSSLNVGRGGFRIPTTRRVPITGLLSSRDFPPGYGPRLRQVAPGPVFADNFIMPPLMLGEHDDNHAGFMDSGYVPLIFEGYNQAHFISGRLRAAATQQRESNAIVTAVMQLETAHPYAARALEDWMAYRFHEVGGVVSWSALRREIARERDEISKRLYLIRRKMQNPRELDIPQEMEAIRRWLASHGVSEGG